MFSKSILSWSRPVAGLAWGHWRKNLAKFPSTNKGKMLWGGRLPAHPNVWSEPLVTRVWAGGQTAEAWSQLLQWISAIDQGPEGNHSLCVPDEHELNKKVHEYVNQPEPCYFLPCMPFYPVTWPLSFMSCKLDRNLPFLWLLVVESQGVGVVVQ